jgi:hypothetical protein
VGSGNYPALQEVAAIPRVFATCFALRYQALLNAEVDIVCSWIFDVILCVATVDMRSSRKVQTDGHKLPGYLLAKPPHGWFSEIDNQGQAVHLRSRRLTLPP